MNVLQNKAALITGAALVEALVAILSLLDKSYLYLQHQQTP